MAIDQAQTNLTVHWKISNSIGWGGLGVGSSMLHSDMVIAWRSNGKVILSPRDSRGRHLPKYTSTNAITLLGNIKSQEEDSNYWYVTYSRPLAPLDGLSLLVETGRNSFIYGFAAQSPNTNDASSGFGFHDDRGNFDYDVILAEPISSKSSTMSSDTLKGAHGNILAFLWIIMTPISVIMARYYKNIGHKWFIFHSMIQFVTVTSTIILGLLMENRYEFKFESTHEIVGAIVIIIGTLQVYSGCYIHLTYDENRAKTPIRDKAHGITGFLIWFMAIYQMISGLNMERSKLKLYFYCFVAATMFFVMIVMQRRRKPIAAYQKLDMN